VVPATQLMHWHEGVLGESLHMTRLQTC